MRFCTDSAWHGLVQGRDHRIFKMLLCCFQSEVKSESQCFTGLSPEHLSVLTAYNKCHYDFWSQYLHDALKFCVLQNNCFLDIHFWILHVGNPLSQREPMISVKRGDGLALAYPGIPPDSSLLAMSTSQDQTSNCHFRRPNTPHSTEPEWIPIRMSTSCFVLDRTYLMT